MKFQIKKDNKNPIINPEIKTPAKQIKDNNLFVFVLYFL